MNGKQAKAVRKLIDQENPFILLKLIQVYGEITKSMTKRQVYQHAKRLVKFEKINVRKLKAIEATVKESA
jgi:hypothetical protein